MQKEIHTKLRFFERRFICMNSSQLKLEVHRT